MDAIEESLLGYHPCDIGFLTAAVNRRWDNARRGLMGRSPPKGYRRRPKVPSEWSETIRRVQRQKGA